MFILTVCGFIKSSSYSESFFTLELLAEPSPISFQFWCAVFGISSLLALLCAWRPSKLEDLECPDCGCPHAWGMIFSQCHVHSKETSTTTTTTETYDGWGLVDKKTETKSVTLYFGNEEKDFHCENCDYKLHTDERRTWAGGMPSVKPYRYKPPKYAFNPNWIEKKTSIWDKIKNNWFIDYFRETPSWVCIFLGILFTYVIRWCFFAILPDFEIYFKDLPLYYQAMWYAIPTIIGWAMMAFWWQWMEFTGCLVWWCILLGLFVFPVVTTPSWQLQIINNADTFESIMIWQHFVLSFREIPLYTDANAKSKTVEPIPSWKFATATGEVKGNFIEVKIGETTGWMFADKHSRKLYLKKFK
jgi:hypothetical protein